MLTINLNVSRKELCLFLLVTLMLHYAAMVSYDVLKGILWGGNINMEHVEHVAVPIREPAAVDKVEGFFPHTSRAGDATITDIKSESDGTSYTYTVRMATGQKRTITSSMPNLKVGELVEVSVSVDNTFRHIYSIQKKQSVATTGGPK